MTIEKRLLNLVEQSVKDKRNYYIGQVCSEAAYIIKNLKAKFRKSQDKVLELQEEIRRLAR